MDEAKFILTARTVARKTGGTVKKEDGSRVEVEYKDERKAADGYFLARRFGLDAVQYNTTLKMYD